MKRMIMAAMMAAALAGQVLAQNAVVPNINQGTKTLEGSGSFKGNVPGGDEWILQLGAGYFVMDGLEVGGVFGFSDNDITSNYDLGVRAEYNFDLGSPWVPYVGAAALWDHVKVEEGDYDDNTFAGRASAGIKYFLRSDVALFLSANYTKAIDEIFVDEDLKTTDYQFSALFGIRYYFD